MTKSSELLQGTLDLLILKVLSLEPMHGWAIARRIHQLSAEVLTVNQGALYPALHRLEHQAWIASSWGESENNRRAKYYTLTKAGRQRLKSEEQSWDRLSVGVQDVLKAIG
jgi:PadR family transcriptional regulator PadR